MSPHMLMIRLQRVGRKNQPSFRLVLTDSKNAAKSGKFLEILGSHSFRKDGTILEADRIKHWMKMGAQVSDSAHNLLLAQKVITGKKINVLPKKTVPKKEEVAA
jgi:small subunit ribosomal protein S16